MTSLIEHLVIHVRAGRQPHPHVYATISRSTFAPSPSAELMRPSDTVVPARRQGLTRVLCRNRIACPSVLEDEVSDGAGVDSTPPRSSNR